MKFLQDLDCSWTPSSVTAVCSLSRALPLGITVLHVCAYKGVEEADAGRHARAPGAFVCAALGVAGANIVLANAVEGCRSICLDLEPLAFCEERLLKLLAAKNLHALLV